MQLLPQRTLVGLVQQVAPPAQLVELQQVPPT
jgi:hypothetical protein